MTRRTVTGRSPSAKDPRVRPVRVIRGRRDASVTVAVGTGDRKAVERATAVLTPGAARELAAALVETADAADGKAGE